MEKIYLYGDRKKIIQKVEIEPIEASDMECYIIPVSQDPFIDYLCHLRKSNLSIGDRRFLLAQDTEGNYHLKVLFYVYYLEDGTIQGISPSRSRDYNETTKTRFALDSVNISKILEGKAGLSYFSVKEIDEQFVELTERKFKVDLTEPKSFNNYKLNFPCENNPDIVLVYNRSKNVLYTEDPTALSKKIGFYLTKKNDPTVIIDGVGKVKIKNKKLFIRVPKLPDKFDIYSNLNSKLKIGYKVE